MRLARPPARLAVLAVLAVALAACAAEANPGWTFAPTPTPTIAPSVAPTAAPSGAASAAPSGEATPAPSGGASGVVLTLAAQGTAYDTDTLEVPANTAFQIVFTNNDAGIPHNTAIHQGAPTGPEVWKGELFNGVATKTYDVPALPAGTYGFVCTVHPNMIGTLTAK